MTSRKRRSNVVRVIVLTLSMGLVGSCLALAAGVASQGSAEAATFSVTVPVSANVFGAGLTCGGGNPSDCPHPGGECPGAHAFCTGRAGGAAPVEVAIASGTTFVTFAASNTPGSVVGWNTTWSGGSPVSCVPFFDTGTAGTSLIGPAGGISGIASPNGAMLHVGVFLTSSGQPASPPPMRFYDLSQPYVAEAPQLGQLFYLGNGTDISSKATHKIVPPPGATKLFLGWIDGPWLGAGTAFAGDPGWYADNVTNHADSGACPNPAGPLAGTVTTHTSPLNAPLTANDRFSPSQVCQLSCSGDPVDTSSGMFSTSTVDASIPGRGLALEAGRRYNSVNVGTRGLLGDGWTSAYEMSLANNTPSTDKVTVKEENGAQTVFTKTGTNGGTDRYMPDNSGVLASLVFNPSTQLWSFTRKRSSKFTFDNTGKLTKLQDLNDMQSGSGTTITYPSASQMVVTDHAGRALTFSINSTTGRVTTLTDPIGREVTYAYDSSNNYLLQVTDPRGAATSFCYNVSPATSGCPAFDSNQKSGVLRVVVDGRGNDMVNVYDSTGRVTSQTSRAGKVTSFNYSASADAACPVTAGVQTTRVTSPNGSDGNPDLITDTYKDGRLVCSSKGGTGTTTATRVFTLDAVLGTVAGETDPNGNTTYSWYDQWGNLVEQVDALGRRTVVAYNKYNRPTTVVDASGVTTTHGYHGTYGWLETEVSRPLVGTSEVQRTVTVYDTSANTHFGDVLEVRDADQSGQTTPLPWVYQRDTTAGAGDNGYVTSLLDPNGNKTTITYDKVGRQTTKVTPNGNTGSSPDNSYRSVSVFDRIGQQTLVLGELANAVGDSFGRAESSTALGTTDTGEAWTANAGTWGIDQSSAYLASGTSGIATVAAAKDGAVALVPTVPQDGVGLIFRYADTNNYWKLAASVTSGYWILTQTVGGSVVQTVNTSAGTCCSARDLVAVALVGSTIAVTVNGVTVGTATDSTLQNNTRVGLAAAGSTAKVSAFAFTATGQVQGTGYDANRNPTFTADAGGLVSKVYDEEDRLVRTNRQDGSHIDNAYWDNGLLAGQYDASGSSSSNTGQLTAYGYDHVRRLTSKIDPEGRTTAYKYDKTGNVLKIKNPDYATDCDPASTMTYDAANQLTQTRYGTFSGANCDQSYAADSTTPDVTYTYDSVGRRSSMTDASGLSCYEWDSLGRLKHYRTNTGAGGGTCSSPGSSTVTTSYTYNLKNQVRFITYPGGTNQVERHYDASGRMDWTKDWNGKQTDFGYDRNNNLTTISYPTTGTTTVESRLFDKSNRLVDNGTTPAISVAQGSTVHGTFGSTRTDLGEVSSNKSVVSGTQTQNETFTYNSLRQLQNVNSNAHAYTTSQAAGYPSADNIRSYAYFGSIMTYDSAHGGDANQPYQMKNASTMAVQRTYAYDNEGRRSQLAISGGATVNYAYDKADRLRSLSTTSPYAVYYYNGDGLRRAKNVYTAIRYFQWDVSASTPMVLRSGNGTNWDHFVYGPDGKPVSRIEINGSTQTTHFITTDQVGSVRLILDTNGAVAGSYDYDPYGRVVRQAGVNMELQFTSEWTDTGDSGFSYLRFRYYDPHTAQFLTRDPLETTTKSPYGYVNNSPLNFTDPLGLAAKAPKPTVVNLIQGINNVSDIVGIGAAVCVITTVVTMGAAFGPCMVIGMVAASVSLGTSIALATTGHGSWVDVLLDGIGFGGGAAAGPLFKGAASSFAAAGKNSAKAASYAQKAAGLSGFSNLAMPFYKAGQYYNQVGALVNRVFGVGFQVTGVAANTTGAAITSVTS